MEPPAMVVDMDEAPIPQDNVPDCFKPVEGNFDQHAHEVDSAYQIKRSQSPTQLPLTPEGTAFSRAKSGEKQHGSSASSSSSPSGQAASARSSSESSGSQIPRRGSSERAVGGDAGARIEDEDMPELVEAEDTATDARWAALAVLNDWFDLSILPITSPSSHTPSSPSLVSTRLPILEIYKAYTSTILPPHVAVCNIDAFVACVNGRGSWKIRSGAIAGRSIAEGTKLESSLNEKIGKIARDLEEADAMDVDEAIPVLSVSTQYVPSTHYTQVLLDAQLHQLTFDQLSGLWARAGADLVDWGRKLLLAKLAAGVGQVVGVKSEEERSSSILTESGRVMTKDSPAKDRREKTSEKVVVRYRLSEPTGLSPSTPTSSQSSRTSTTVAPKLETEMELVQQSTINTSTASMPTKSYRPGREIPDDHFTVEVESSLPCPQASFRRVFDIVLSAKVQDACADRAESAIGNTGKKHEGGKGDGSGMPRGKMGFCRQVIGEEGGKLIAQQWLRTCIQRPSKPQGSPFVRFEDIYGEYASYPNHPPNVPQVSKAEMLGLVFQLYPISGGHVPHIPTTDRVGAQGPNEQTKEQISGPSEMDAITFRGIRILTPSSVALKDHAQIWQTIGFNFRLYSAKRLRAEAKAKAEVEKRVAEITLAAEEEVRWMDEWWECRARGSEMSLESGARGGATESEKLEGDRVGPSAMDTKAINPSRQRRRDFVISMREKDRRGSKQNGSDFPPARCSEKKESRIDHHLERIKAGKEINGKGGSRPVDPCNTYSQHGPRQDDTRTQQTTPTILAPRNVSSYHRPDLHDSARPNMARDPPAIGPRPVHSFDHLLHRPHPLAPGTVYQQQRQQQHQQPQQPPPQLHQRQQVHHQPASAWPPHRSPRSSPAMSTPHLPHPPQPSSHMSHRLGEVQPVGILRYPSSGSWPPPPPQVVSSLVGSTRYAAGDAVGLGRWQALAPQQARDRIYAEKGHEHEGSHGMGQSARSEVTTADPVTQWLTREYAFGPHSVITQRDLWLSFVRYITSLGPDLARRYNDIQPQALFHVVVDAFGCKVVKRPKTGEVGGGEYVIEGMGRRG